MTLMEQLEQLEKFVASGNFSDEELKELETLSEEIITCIQKEYEVKPMRKYFKLLTKENKEKLFAALQNGMPLKCVGLVIGKVERWVWQLNDIYGEVSFYRELLDDDFDLILYGDHVQIISDETKVDRLTLLEKEVSDLKLAVERLENKNVQN